MSSSYIYVLRELGNAEVRYVGQTQSPQHRFYSYSNGSDIKNLRDSNLRKSWLSGLYSTGIGFDMEVIEECSLSIVTQREDYWMKYYRALGHRLTNMSQPGNSSSMQMNILKRSTKHDSVEIVAMSLIYRHAGLMSIGNDHPVGEDKSIDEIRQDVKELKASDDAIKSTLIEHGALLRLLCEKLSVEAQS